MKLRKLFSILLALCLLSSSVTAFADGALFTEENPWIRLPRDVEPAMLDVDFWLELAKEQGDPGVLLLTLPQIRAINEQNKKMLVLDSGAAFALTDIGPSLDGAVVRELMAVYERPADPADRYINGSQSSREYWDALVQNANEAAVAEAVSIRYGFTVKPVDVRALPTADYISRSAGDLLRDRNARAEYPAYAPVAVAHESLDGAWYYVICESFAGWAPKESIALCSSREDWLSRQDPEHFLVVTGRELHLPEDPYSPATSGMRLPMGTILPLLPAAQAPEDFNGRRSFGCYIAQVPVRLSDGSIGNSPVLIPVSEDVSPGFLPYTQENLLTLLFKRLGDRYGWAGMYGANDCSGMLREAFACFGFHFPRNAAVQIRQQGMQSTDLSSLSEQEKLSLLADCPTGTLLHFPGHIMVYLGTYQETPYVISAVSGFTTPEQNEGETTLANSVVLNSLSGTRRMDGETWLWWIDRALICQ